MAESLGYLLYGYSKSVHLLKKSQQLGIEKIDSSRLSHFLRCVRREEISNSALRINNLSILKLVESTEHRAGIDSKLDGHLTNGWEFSARRPFTVDYP